ncbi:MAG: chain-length determining protein [Syntrophales bacterium LBB04]|nr:chain-length determining protein [Syntrophales bacterium LBB04]
MEENVKTVGDLVDVMRRRRWSLVLPALLIFIAASVVAVALPSYYRSSSTILIEEQEIPRDFVLATVTSYAEQRLQTINQRIMSTTRLLEIINRFGLYRDLRSSYTLEEIIARMRKDIRLQTISAEVVDRRTGRPTSATIAFSLSYEGKNPEVVQQVANVLASLYLEENLKVREQQTRGASRFLEEEANGLLQQLSSTEARISEFKQQNIDTLPELLQVNLQGLDRVERDVEKLNDQVKTMKEREEYLQSQLASIPTDVQGQDKTLLKELKAKLVQLQSRFSDKYPDVIKTKTEIAELEKRVVLQQKPEGKLLTRKEGLPIVEQPDNPAFVTLAAQLASTQSEIASLQRQLSDTNKKREEYHKRAEATPRVEEAYRLLTIERNNLQLKYDDLMRKLMEARVAHGLEKEQMSERFTMIDPPKLPEKPISPNIPAILLIGLVLGVGGGTGAASLKEYSDKSVRGFADLARVTSVPVLASIPVIVTWRDRVRLKRKRLLIAGVSAAVIVVTAFVIHFFVMNLEVLMTRVMRALNL